MKSKAIIRTRRLQIQPMSDLEIEERIAESDTDESRAAYGEMLAGCRRDPDNRVWYAPWKMTLKGDPAYIGDLGFKGPSHEHAVEIGYGILAEQEGNGYTTEAVQAMTQWAFGHANVVFIEAETAPDNEASRRVLAKCGFFPDGTGEEGPRFVLESPLTNWMAIYMLFGIGIGSALGTISDHIATGMSMGMCLGLCIGALLDSSAKKERDQLRKQRKRSLPN